MSEILGVRRLPLADMVERHPKDGWTLAEPLPLSPRTQRALEGVAFALLPPRPAPRTIELDQRVVTHVRRMLRYMPPTLRLGFLLLVRLLNLSPIWRFQAFSTIANLEPARGSRILQDIALSRIMLLRLMMLAPQAMILSPSLAPDEVHKVLGYEPKGFLRERIQRREQLLSENASTYQRAEVAE